MIFVNPDICQGYRFPSLGMLTLAAILRGRGLPAGYVDCNYDADWKSKLSGLVNDDPLVGITANVLSIKPAMRIARYIREAHPGARIVMGGPYPTIEYERIVPEYADAAVLGEGEAAAVALAEGRPFSEIAGLAFRDNGGVVVNPRRDTLTDVDTLPVPAWDLGHIAKYRLPHTKRNPILSTMTSRGCPFNCVYCGSDIINKNQIRFRSVDHVLEEIDALYKFGAREIHIWDDNFTLKKDRAIEICEGIARRGYRDLSLAIPSGIKPDIGDDELFRAMARAGFYFLCIAVESGSQEVLNQCGKKVNLERVPEVIRAARRAGILLNGFFMIGLPFDTRETMEQTIAFARTLPLHQALFFMTIPFPGTDLFNIVKERGRFLYHTDDDLYEKGYFQGRASYEMPGQFDAALIESMYKKAYRSFFMSPGRLLSLLFKRIRSPKDVFYLAYKGLRVIFLGRQF